MATDDRVFMGIFAFIGTLVVAVYGWLLLHLRGHLSKKSVDDKFGKVVFMDVCEEKVKRLDDCIEAEAKRSTERYEALKETMENGFKDVKELIRRNGNRGP